MKKAILFVLFIVVLTATIMYYDDPRYYQKQFKKQSRRFSKQMDCWQDYFHDMMPF